MSIANQTIEMLNTIRSNASTDYQNRIPEATWENLPTIGGALSLYTPLKNEFFTELINKIGKTILETKLFKNRLAPFKSGMITSQQDVEEIFINMNKAEGVYNPAGPNPLGRREGPNVIPTYHRMNRQNVYTISIGDVDFLRVFRSEATLSSFVTGLINSVYSGAAYDEYLMMKALFSKFEIYTDYQVSAITNAETAKDFVKTVRKASNDISFPVEIFEGCTTWSEPEDQVLFVHKDVVAEVDVEVLAKSFNMGKTDFQSRVIVLDDFGPDMTDTYAILTDKDWFRAWDTLSHMEGQRNAEGLFTNYFYHVHQILSLSPFKPVIRFRTGIVA